MIHDSCGGPVSKGALWTGCVMSALPALGLLMSGVMKLLRPEAVIQGFEGLGWPTSLAIAIGLVEIGCTVVYLIPRTAVLGAILITGYLGGATATHVRVEEAFLGPIVFGILVWGGLYLRDRRVRALIPFRTCSRAHTIGDAAYIAPAAGAGTND